MKNCRVRKRGFIRLKTPISIEVETYNLPTKSVCKIPPPHWYDSDPPSDGDVRFEDLKASTLRRIELLAKPQREIQTPVSSEGRTAQMKDWDLKGHTLTEECDFLSHLCLRVAVASEVLRNPSIARWFEFTEARLFRIRLNQWLEEDLSEPSPDNEWWNHVYGLRFCKDSGDNSGQCHEQNYLFTTEWQQAQRHKFQALWKKRRCSDGQSASETSAGPERTSYWRVPFGEGGSALVGKRRVAIDRGFALVPHHDMPEVVAARYRLFLRAKVEELSYNFAPGLVSQDHRFADLFSQVVEAVAWYSGEKTLALSSSSIVSGDQGQGRRALPGIQKFVSASGGGPGTNSHSRSSGGSSTRVAGGVGADKEETDGGEERAEHRFGEEEEDDDLGWSGGVEGPQDSGKEQQAWEDPGPMTTLDRLHWGAQQGSLPLCASRLHHLLHGTAAAPTSSTESGHGFGRAGAAGAGSKGKDAPGMVGWLHHDQRRQYLLFLKACGLGVAATLSVFRKAFNKANARAHVGAFAEGSASSSSSNSTASTTTTTAPAAAAAAAGLAAQVPPGAGLIQPKRRWERYEYDIKHHYGLKGKRVECEPFTCGNLAKMPPKASDRGVGGCPFVHLEPAALSAALEQSGLPLPDAAAIAKRAAAMHDQQQQQPPPLGVGGCGDFAGAAGGVGSGREEASSEQGVVWADGGGSSGSSEFGPRGARDATELCRLHFDLLHSHKHRTAALLLPPQAGSRRERGRPGAVPSLASMLGLELGSGSSSWQAASSGQPHTGLRHGSHMCPSQWTAASEILHLNWIRQRQGAGRHDEAGPS